MNVQLLLANLNDLTHQKGEESKKQKPNQNKNKTKPKNKNANQLSNFIQNTGIG